MSEQTIGTRRDPEAHRIARARQDEAHKPPLLRDPRPEILARPLGVRPDLELTDAQWAALQRLEAYDLAPVRARLLKQGVLPADRVDDAIFEFRRFLGLAVVGCQRRLAVSGPAVDEVWHTCLLFSRLYADLCEQTVGRFVHHEPLMEGPGDEARLHEGKRLFEQAYSRVYGEMTTLRALIELTDEELAGAVGGGGKSGSVLDR